MQEKSKTEQKEIAVHKRHQRVWNFFWYFTRRFFMAMHKYTCELAPDIKGPCIILSNHTCELDPVLLGCSFKKQMYFVASEHVYRKGWVSKLLFWAFEPIAKIKGSTDALTVMKAIRRLKNGYNVCIFAEGSRSFDGRNSPIPPATAKLVKTCGATLVTYRIEGGYLTNPRWGFGIRKGKCYGHVVNVYSPDQIAQMPVEQVNKIIVDDLHEDAYERQLKSPVAYKGKNRALGMECAYCVCPRCNTLGKISTIKNKVFCNFCSNSSVFDEYGNFEDSFGVKNTEEWEDFQESFFDRLVERKDVNAKEVPYFSDEGVSLKTVDASHNEKNLGNGKMALYQDRFVFVPEGLQSITIMINDIFDMSVYSRNGFVFTDSSGVHYEIKPIVKKSPLNVRKYISVWKRLRTIMSS